MVAIDDL